MEMFLVISVFAFILGVSVGSFLNSVIYRLEKKKSLGGRSFCPHCKHQLNWKDLFPVLSFVFLNGKCRYCKKKISGQYPLTELLVGLLFLFIFQYQFYSAEVFSSFEAITSLFLFYIWASFLVIFIYDLKHYIIPDKILFPAIFITISFKILTALYIGQVNYLGDYILGALVASGFFFIIFIISKGKWMGFGDVKLAILMGLLLGSMKVILAILLASVLGSLIGVALIFSNLRKWKSQIPFAPFLIVGTFIMMFWGQEIVNWYFNYLSNVVSAY